MMEMPSASVLFASLLFGSVGFAVFMYGKKSMHWQPMIIGVALMVYPYFVENVLLLYAIGIALSISLFVFRD
jgi:hypothetical protein